MGTNVLVTVLLAPLLNAKFVLDGAQELGLFPGGLSSAIEHGEDLSISPFAQSATLTFPMAGFEVLRVLRL